MLDADKHVPEEISRSKGLNSATWSRVCPQPFISSEVRPPLVQEDDPQRVDGNEDGLDEGNHTHVPVDLGPSWKATVDLRPEKA